MDDQEKLINRALLSVFFWAQERTTEPAPLSEILPMAVALTTLVAQTGEKAMRALRLGYAEAARVYPRLSGQEKQALQTLAQQLGLPPLTDGDANRTDQARLIDVLKAMGGRNVASYEVRVKT